MKGLLLKDWYVLWKLGKLYFVMMLAFLFFSLSQSGYFYVCFIAVLMAMLPITALSMDERSKWHIYAAALPYSPATIVAEKYVLGLIFVLAPMVLRVAAGAVYGAVSGTPQDLLLPAFLMLIAGFAPMAVNYPIVFKFGTENGRVAYLIFIVIFSAAVSASYVVLRDVDMSFLDRLPGVPVALVPVGSLLLTALSMLLSIQIYKKKEF